jgi:uncharacterized membrane protein YfcA
MLNELILIGLAFVQTTSFSVVSRARNRNHMGYHMAASVVSNLVWFATFRQLAVVHEFGWEVAPWYIIGTLLGSMFGAKLSMRIEQLIGAQT